MCPRNTYTSGSVPKEKAAKHGKLAQEAPMRKSEARLVRSQGPGNRPAPGCSAAAASPSPAVVGLLQRRSCPPWPREGAQHLHMAPPPASRGPLTVEALHLWLLALWLLLKPLGLATLLAVEHEAQDGNDVGHGGTHGQPNGLDHLVGGRAAWALRLLQHRLV